MNKQQPPRRKREKKFVRDPKKNKYKNNKPETQNTFPITKNKK